jgi:hypothetical protein
MGQSQDDLVKAVGELSTAMGTVYEKICESELQGKQRDNQNNQELRAWAQTNKALVEMLANQIQITTDLTKKIGQLETSLDRLTHSSVLSPSDSKFSALKSQKLEDLEEQGKNIRAEILQNQQMLKSVKSDTSQINKHIEERRKGEEDDDDEVLERGIIARGQAKNRPFIAWIKMPFWYGMVCLALWFSYDNLSKNSYYEYSASYKQDLEIKETTKKLEVKIDRLQRYFGIKSK